MVPVRLTKKNGRLSQGTVGVISDADYKNYGIGKPSDDNYVFPRLISFYVNNAEWSVQNILLEKTTCTAKHEKTRKTARPQMKMNL